MRSRAIITASVMAIALAACGGGDDAQEELADEFLDAMEEEDVEVDSDCVRDAFDQLDDDDARAVLDSLDDSSEPDVSPEAEGVVDDLLGCIDIEQMLEDIDASIPDLTIPDISIPDISIPDISIPDLSIPDISVPDIDEFLEGLDIEGLDTECFQQVLDETDMATATPQELAAAAFECIDIGG